MVPAVGRKVLLQGSRTLKPKTGWSQALCVRLQARATVKIFYPHTIQTMIRLRMRTHHKLSKAKGRHIILITYV